MPGRGLHDHRMINHTHFASTQLFDAADLRRKVIGFNIEMNARFIVMAHTLSMIFSPNSPCGRNSRKISAMM
jgi:hypothetical protein